MSDNRIITLTTDFGYKDPFAAEMKGVILSINPNAKIVDVSHGMEPQDIHAAAYVIGTSFGYFPPGSVHVVVVDPGVGSERRPVMLGAGGHYFIGPDNGVFSYILRSTAVTGVHITGEKYMLSKQSPTFQGRDLFAPVAAWLSKGTDPASFGPQTDHFVTLPAAAARRVEGGMTGEIIYIDHFGNSITNITGDDLAATGGISGVRINDRDLRMVRYYAEADEDSLCCLINSSGYLEIFVNRGNAALEYSLNKGDKVNIQN